MIVKDGTKQQQVFFDGKQIFKIYKGDDMIYTTYIKPQMRNVVFKNGVGGSVTFGVRSNEKWFIE